MAGRILIADDVATNRIILKVKLSAAFYRLDQAVSARDVLDRLETDRPDLVIVSQNLPDMPAAELCRRIKSDPATAIVPVTVQRLLGSEQPLDDPLGAPLPRIC